MTPQHHIAPSQEECRLQRPSDHCSKGFSHSLSFSLQGVSIFIISHTVTRRTQLITKKTETWTGVKAFRGWLPQATRRQASSIPGGFRCDGLSRCVMGENRLDAEKKQKNGPTSIHLCRRGLERISQKRRKKLNQHSKRIRPDRPSNQTTPALIALDGDYMQNMVHRPPCCFSLCCRSPYDRKKVFPPGGTRRAAREIREIINWIMEHPEARDTER